MVVLHGNGGFCCCLTRVVQVPLTPWLYTDLWSSQLQPCCSSSFMYLKVWGTCLFSSISVLFLLFSSSVHQRRAPHVGLVLLQVSSCCRGPSLATVACWGLALGLCQEPGDYLDCARCCLKNLNWIVTIDTVLNSLHHSVNLFFFLIIVTIIKRKEGVGDKCQINISWDIYLNLLAESFPTTVIPASYWELMRDILTEKIEDFFCAFCFWKV